MGKPQTISRRLGAAAAALAQVEKIEAALQTLRQKGSVAVLEARGLGWHATTVDAGLARGLLEAERRRARGELAACVRRLRGWPGYHTHWTPLPAPPVEPPSPTTEETA